MTGLPNPLTPAELDQVRETFSLFETILNPYERAERQTRLILVCVSVGVPLSSVGPLDA